MDIANCKCKDTGKICVNDEPYSTCDFPFKEDVENYDDYLNNRKYCEAKRNELYVEFNYYQRLEKNNDIKLKNLFLSEYIETDKRIKGLCIHETKGIEDPYYHEYSYIIGFNRNTIGENGLYVNCIHIQFHKIDGHLTYCSIRKENSYFISYNQLYSCQITKKEFMEVYDRVNCEINKNLGLELKKDNA